MQTTIASNLLPSMFTACAMAARQFAPRIKPDGSEVLGQVYLEMSELAEKDGTILKDDSRFRRIARARARWEILRLLRDRP